MKIDVIDRSISDVTSNKYDFFIFSSGYEMRSRSLLRKMHGILPSDDHRKLCIGFSDYRDIFDRKKNDEVFARNNFTFIDEQDLDFGNLSRRIIHSALSREDNDGQVSFLIDYSVMRRSWYSEILLAFKELSARNVRITATFSYTIGSYMGKKQPKVVADYKLIPGYEGISSQRREKFGIYSLGFEPISVQSLHDWAEPTDVKCIIASPGSSSGSTRNSYEMNRDFISDNNISVIETPLRSVRRYCEIISDLIKRNIDEYDIILFGEGPKPFSLGNFICSMSGANISSIYLEGRESEPINVAPRNDFVITDVIIS